VADAAGELVDAVGEFIHAEFTIALEAESVKPKL
jgi:hypothetical protein